VVLPLPPVTVKVAGVLSEAGAEAGDTVPWLQLSVTVTEAGLLSVKSYATTNEACALFTIVQLAGTPSAIATFAQLDWLAT